MLAQLAQQLEMPPDVFESIFDKPPVLTDGVAASTLDTIHYPAPNMTGPLVDANASANCEAHVDKGLLTLIFPDTEQGLQVKAATEPMHPAFSIRSIAHCKQFSSSACFALHPLHCPRTFVDVLEQISTGLCLWICMPYPESHLCLNRKEVIECSAWLQCLR